MVFSSLFFLCVFLPLNIMLYFISSNKTYRNIFLLLSSLSFYAWGEPVWVIILIFTGIFDSLNGLIVEKYRGLWQSKAALITSIVVNLLILGFFKYSAFLTININVFFGINLPYSEFRLPIGISFYTFQSMSYVIDVHRGDVAAQKSPYKYLLFVSLFHQLVAGPIVRYKDIANQIEERFIRKENFVNGINRFVLGLGKKVILANTAGEIAIMFLDSDMSKLSILGAWLGIVMYSIQIYFDFSGYSDMAIGLGMMFGFTYKENFNYPYISKSATEFWRRWHISLGSFFRDYVYIPLGGNKANTIRNLLIVWGLTGLWHGASWNFLLWGLYYGILIIIEKHLLLTVFEKLPAFLSHAYLILVMLIGWVFFYYTSLSNAIELLGVMFGFSGNSLIDSTFEINFFINIVFIVIAIAACSPIFKIIANRISMLVESYRTTSKVFNEMMIPLFNFIVLAISIILLVGETYNPFIYFRF